MELRDSFRGNIAAFHVDRVLGLGMVPVAVERSIDGRRGALSWWVDDAMTELERRAAGVEAPDPIAWQRQIHTGVRSARRQCRPQ